MAENEANLPAGDETPDMSADQNRSDEWSAGADRDTNADAATSAGDDTANNAASTEDAEDAATAEDAARAEEITYHAVERDGHVAAIWEMQGRKHLRTIDPRSRQGQDILRLYTSEHHDDAAPHEAADAATAQQ